MLRSLKTIIYYSFKVGSQQTFVMLKTSFILVFKRRLQDVLIKTNIFALLIRLQKTSWSRPIYSSWSYVFKTCSNVFKTSSRCLAKTSSKRLAKTSWRGFQSVFKTSCKSVFKTFSRRFENVFKVSLRRFCEYHEVELLLLKRFQDIFKTHSQRF